MEKLEEKKETLEKKIEEKQSIIHQINVENRNYAHQLGLTPEQVQEAKNDPPVIDLDF